uniref:Interferon-induced very large GTPase 1 domain-containing protein n=1 Tax=Poecilia reticulata TaxID=8081 RepID=A0A3P9PQT0_POERE
MTKKLLDYYKRKDVHAHLIEKYRQDFINNIKSLAREIQYSTSHKLDCAGELKKTSDFVKLCLRPAVEDFINRTLGIDIVDEILKNHDSEEYSSRSFFSYNIQKELLQKDDLEGFGKYISKYELYIKNWIFLHIQQKVSQDKTLTNLKNKSLQIIVDKITEAIKNSSKDGEGVLLPDDTENLSKFISRMQKYLVKDLSFSVEAEKTSLFPTEIKCQVFIDSLLTSVNELKEKLQEEFTSSEDVTDTINKLLIKPQDELFRRVFGCGRQCPFCKVPCDAGGKEHLQHQAAVHRPQGLGGSRYEDDNKLVETLCTTDVCSEHYFKNADTESEGHPYKKYVDFYPHWKIQPDSTTEVTDYWKYVLATYNDHFAKLYKAKPADVPEDWKNITKEQALKGLEDAFEISMKLKRFYKRNI